MGNMASDFLEHDRFKELAALAAIGQLSALEYRDLQSHLEMCSDCREECAEFQNTLHGELPLIYPSKDIPLKQRFMMADGATYRKRFAERARAEGFALSPEVSLSERLRYRLDGWLTPSPAPAYAVVALLAIAVGVLGYEWRETRIRYLNRDAEVATLNRENTGLRKRLAELGNAQSDTPGLANGTRSVDADRARLEAELVKTNAKYVDLADRYAAIEAKLARAVSESQTLSAEAQAEREREGSLAEKLRQTEASLGQMAGELQTLRKADDETRHMADRLARVEELERELATATDALDRAKRLLVADHDIRDLMGARNLHITDVYDVDSKGKTRQAFGRAFYTEGKSLIFYAFDLGKAKPPLSERSYQAWGYQEAAHKSQSLGMLYLDDKNQNRWALKFNDAAVLSEIDAVFVTVEPPGGSGQPTGQKLLYAYLGATANHP
jgi:uncharacterized protein YhaN